MFVRLASACILALTAPLTAQIAFTEVASEVGLDHVTDAGPPDVPPPSDPIVAANLGAGCAVGDYDGDGDIDVYLLQGRGFPNRLFRNELVETGSARFADVTAASGTGLDDLGSGRTAHFADLDGDADLDLLLVNDRDPSGTAFPSRLFENRGNGRFEDVTEGSGFSPVGIALCGCSLADYDQDGLLDVFVTAWAHHLGFPSPFHQWPGENRLYRNLGDFEFVDVTNDVGLGPHPERLDAFTAIFADITKNGYPDLYIAIDHEIDQFWANEGGTFRLRSEEFGLTHLGNDMGLACADVDHDGDLDFYQTNITDPVGRFGTTQFNALMLQDRTPAGGTVFYDEADPSLRRGHVLGLGNAVRRPGQRR